MTQFSGGGGGGGGGGLFVIGNSAFLLIQLAKLIFKSGARFLPNYV